MPIASRLAEKLKDLIGLTKNDAQEKLEEAGFKLRVVNEDGKSKMTSFDLRSNRINVAIKGGLISEIKNVG